MKEFIICNKKIILEELFMKKAKKMLLAGFLACTMLATGAALAGCGDDTSSSSGGGDSSSTSTPTTSTPDPWELGNASVTYIVDKDGVETAVYTVVSADGEEYTKSVATGRKVVATQGEVKVNGERFEGGIETTVGNKPKVEVLALFDDGTASWVTITDDMYVGAKPDYTKAGLYTAQFKLVDRYMAPVLVSDGEPVAVQGMLLNEQMGGMCLLWDKADVVAGTYDVSSVFWRYGTYLNGEMSEAIANATADQIKPIDWTAESAEGVYNFSVTDAAGNSGILQAYVLDDNSETSVEVEQGMLISFTMMEQLTALKGSDVSAIDTSDMLVSEMLTIGEGAAMAVRIAEIPEDAEFTLDTSECGTQALTATWTENEAPVTAMTSVFVYENKEEVGEIYSIRVNSYKVVESGLADIQLNVSMDVQYTEGTGDDKNVLQSTQKYSYEYIPLTADMIKGTAPDFTTAGVKVFTVEFCGNEYTYAIELWAEEEAEKPVATTTNIASIDLPEEITLLKDQNIELYVRQSFVNQSAQITYIEPVNGTNYTYAMLKADAFDWSAVKTDVVGEYALKVTYEGYTQEITVNVVAELSEPEEVETVALLQVEMGAVQGYDFFAIELYSDNSAMITNGNPMWGEPEMIPATYELDEATGKLVLYWERWGSEEFAIVAVMDTDTDGAYDYVMLYTFGEPTVEYVINYFGEEQTLKLYEDEGYGELVNEWGYVTFSGAYTLENGILTIAGNKFYVQGTGADAQVLELQSGDY